MTSKPNSQDAQQDAQQGAQQDTQQRAQQSLPQDAQQGLPQDVQQGAPQDLPQDAERSSASKSLDALLDGVSRFQSETFSQQREAFEELAQGQSPHTLFITCADSRVAPELITTVGMGEIFVCRNIGNIVPAYGEMLGGVSAVIEYAVIALQVKNIVICGHTNCGAMKALSAGPALLEKSMPTVRAWLRNAESARTVVQAMHGDEGVDDPDALAFQNVVSQLTHLRTHPSVAARLADGSLEIHGWVFNIGSGRVSVLDGHGSWMTDLRN
jgi:carbonic anhydrase